MRNNENTIANALIAALMGVAIGALVLCCFIGCKSQQVTNNEQHRDSVAVHHRYDTTFITITDTLHITMQQSEKKDEGAVIDFVESGGTMNFITGEVQGVKSVKSTRQQQTDTEVIAEWQRRVESLQATSDSLWQVLKTYKIAGEKKTNTADIKPTRSSYDRFCSWFFWCVLIVGVLACVVWWSNRRWGWLSFVWRLFAH